MSKQAPKHELPSSTNNTVFSVMSNWIVHVPNNYILWPVGCVCGLDHFSFVLLHSLWLVTPCEVTLHFSSQNITFTDFWGLSAYDCLPRTHNVVFLNCPEFAECGRYVHTFTRLWWWLLTPNRSPQLAIFERTHGIFTVHVQISDHNFSTFRFSQCLEGRERAH